MASQGSKAVHTTSGGEESEGREGRNLIVIIECLHMYSPSHDDTANIDCSV